MTAAGADRGLGGDGSVVHPVPSAAGAARQRYAFTEDQQVLLRAKQGLDRMAALEFEQAEW